MNFPELKAAMARKNISIPQLASMMNLSKKTLYSRFSGETDFTLPEIKQIAVILDLSYEEIRLIFFDEKVA